ncbi:MAG: hypothetical protein JXB88_13465 [Spirochaetales bacterium]|nr:hypothetical protein [Spirochaetales bacterium]
MIDIKTQLVKINAMLENIGSKLSKVKNDPSLEMKLEDVINNSIADVIELTIKLIDSNEVNNQKLLEILKDINGKDIKLRWAEYSAAIKKYVNDPEYLWEK